MALSHLLIVKVIEIIVAVLLSCLGSLVGKSTEKNVALSRLQYLLVFIPTVGSLPLLQQVQQPECVIFVIFLFLLKPTQELNHTYLKTTHHESYFQNSAPHMSVSQSPTLQLQGKEVRSNHSSLLHLTVSTHQVSTSERAKDQEGQIRATGSVLLGFWLTCSKVEERLPLRKPSLMT